MLLLRLPNEILIQVAHYLDPKSFTNLLLTNRFFCSLLTPLLHNIAFADKPTNLLWACKRGHEPLARLLLASGTSPDVRSPVQCRHALHEASDYGHEPIVRLLLQHSAQITAEDIDGATALHYAASSANLDIVRVLLQHGADICINKEMEHWFTPLLWAVKGIEVAYSRELEKANPECTWEYYWMEEGLVGTYFSEGQQQRFRDDVIERLFNVVTILLEYGADIHACDAQGGSVLHAAASLSGFNSEAVVGLLLDNGAEVNALDDSGMTPLYHAAVNGLMKVAVLLVKRGADCNRFGGRGDSSLLGVSEEDTETLLSLAGHDCITPILEGQESN